MPAGHHGTALGILASAVAVVAVLAGTIGRAAADQNRAGRAFGPGHCGPIDASYVRVANATGGQVLPLGPSEVGAAAPLIAASSNAETVSWATARLASSAETITVPVDGVTSRVAFVLSTDGSITDMTVSDPRGALVTGGTGVDAFSFGCVRGFAVERPVAGEWTVRAAGAGTYWLVVHVRSDLGLDDAAFVQVAGRPAHEGLFKIPGQPVAGRPATLRARVTREDVTDATFDLVSMSGGRLQAIALSPVTTSSTEEEYVGEIASLPTLPFRVRVSGRDRTGAVYQRVSRRTFHAATVEVVAPQTITLARGQRTPVTVGVRSVGAPARLQIVAVLNATVLRVEPATVQLSANQSRDVTVWADVPSDGTLPSPEIVVTAESPTDPAAADSAIIRATLLDPVR
jgi:von Willebrand factor A domain-containing protein 7